MKTAESDASNEIGIAMLQYLDGTLGSAEVDRLNQRLKEDKVLCREAAAILLQELQMIDLAQEERARRSLEQAEPPPAPKRRWKWLALFPNLKANLRWATGLAIATSILVIALFGLNRAFSTAPFLAELDGTALIERDGRERPASIESYLNVGDRVLVGPDSSVTIGYRREATQLRILESTRVSLVSDDTMKCFQLESGTIDAVVAPQTRGSPFRVLTTHGEARVIGTQFSLTAGDQDAFLEVHSGTVRLTRWTDGASIDVAQGESSLLAAGAPLEAKPLIQGALREFWPNIAGSKVEDLRRAPSFPDQPSERAYIDRLELPSKLGDSYGIRLRGWLRAPRTGAYQFWIAADDAAEFWLGRNENPGSREQICRTVEFTGPREWDKRPEQASPTVSLTAGRRYYFEVLMKQGGGAECLSVAWQGPGLSRQVIERGYLSPPRLNRDLIR